MIEAPSAVLSPRQGSHLATPDYFCPPPLFQAEQKSLLWAPVPPPQSISCYSPSSLLPFLGTIPTANISITAPFVQKSHPFRTWPTFAGISMNSGQTSFVKLVASSSFRRGQERSCSGDLQFAWSVFRGCVSVRRVNHFPPSSSFLSL